MEVTNISFAGRKTKSALSDKSAGKKTKNRKHKYSERVSFSSPGNYEIYLRPYSSKASLIKEVGDSFTKNTEKATTQTQNTEKKSDEDNFGLPKELSEEIDKIVDSATKGKNQKTKTKTKNIVKTIAGITYSVILVGGSIFGTAHYKNNENYVPESVTAEYNSTEEGLKEVADAYNIDEEIIEYINNIDEYDDIKENNELIIPSKYEYLSDEANNILDKLYKSKDMDTNDIQKYGRIIDALNKKKEEQERISSMYTDGEYVYIALKDFSSEKELGEIYGGNSLTDDYISELYDIKDGELRKYNTYGFSADKNVKGATVASGTILKVPKSSIDKENINLEKYME